MAPLETVVGMVALLLVTLPPCYPAGREKRQFNFGSLFGNNRNNNNNQGGGGGINFGAIAGELLNNANRNQQNGGNIDLGAIAGTFLRNPQVQGSINQLTGNIFNGVVSNQQQLSESEFEVSQEGCAIQNEIIEDDFSGFAKGKVGRRRRKRQGGGRRRNRPNRRRGEHSETKELCNCWQKRVNFLGGDLAIPGNPTQVGSPRECQTKCQNTPKCSNWSYLRKRRGGSGTNKCWLKGDYYIRSQDSQLISGPRECFNWVPGSCRTVGGSRVGATCKFPFLYKGKQYNGCILEDADDNKHWCSTLLDASGTHVGGGGNWGHCGSDCPNDNTGTADSVSVATEGDLASSGLTSLPWFPADGKLNIPVGDVTAQGTDITSNRFLLFGVNEPDVASGVCTAPGGGTGTCRHLQHCLKPAYNDFITFLTHLCIINGRFLGVCCPDPPVVTTTTTTTTPAPGPAPVPLRSCGTNAKNFQTRIVGGRPADPKEWPWIAALVRPSTQDSGQYCGGALISSSHVLTAAHCLAPFSANEIQVKLGEYDFKQVGETGDAVFNVLSMKSHEQYNPKTYEHDIAIIKLDRPVTKSDSIWPVCLPAPTEKFENTRAFVVGWGTIYFGGPTSDILQEVNVRIWDNSECGANYGKLNRTIAPGMMCGGEQNKDACQGDSGGPLNCMDPLTGTWRLCGVVSWGAKCAEPDYPGVYTRTTSYLDWISANSV